jgi:ring-1,2-phenylacetyl-CoA epoxidase subunit PaaC
MNVALKEFLYKMADDQLIIGHRNSEWTGFGPFLEEDIAFSSMAQDKIGHSHALFQILYELGEAVPDTAAFMRSAEQFRNCIYVELPNGEYEFSLMRHFLFDTSERIRFQLLSESSFSPLAALARKIVGELRYHCAHADTWIKRLGSATDESVSRLQTALDHGLPFALGICEPVAGEDRLKVDGIYPGDQVLFERWKDAVERVLAATKLQLPGWDSIKPVYGGRSGVHSEYLGPLLQEMSEVFRIDPLAEW